MAYVSNNCWGFRRADLQSAVSCCGSIPLQTRTVRRCLKVSSSRLHIEHSSSSRHCKQSSRHSRRKVTASAAGERTKRGRGAPSTTQPPPPDDGSGRLRDFRVPPVIPGPQLEIPDAVWEDDVEEEEDVEEDAEEGDEHETVEEEEDEEDPFAFPDDDPRAHGGYTPFEELDWSEEDITHELSIHVDAPRSTCFQMWQDRYNYLEWFDSIAQLIGHREDPNLVSLFIFYQWAETPLLELYTTLCRTEVHEDEHILEESVDGMDFVAGVLFADAEGKSGTDVTLRVGYYLPEQLNEFVGAIPVYGDVNDILEASMFRMKAFIEAVDWEKLQQVREDARVQEEQENQEEAKEFHAEFGSDEEIYSQAKKAAAEYLSELGEEDEEEDEEDEHEAAREPTEEEWDDAPEYGPDEFTPVDEDALPDYLTSVNLDDEGNVESINEDSSAATSELASPQPGTTSTGEVTLEPQQAEAASRRDQATATEQQAAADMSSMFQQDVGQFDEAQASRVSPESMLSVPPLEGTAPEEGSQQQHGEEDMQQQPQQGIDAQSGAASPQISKGAAKPKKKPGRPKKKVDDSTPKKKPGRRKKGDTLQE